MATRRAIAVAVGMLAVAAPAHAADLAVDARAIGGTNDPAGPPYSVKARVSGGGLRGAIVFQQRADGQRFTGSFTYYDAKGTLRGTSAGTSGEPQGTEVAFTDELRVTSGTGRYRGATGTLTATGRADRQTGFVDERIRGRLTIAGAASPKPPSRRRERVLRATAAAELAQSEGPIAVLVGTVGRSGMLVVRLDQGDPASASFELFDGRGLLRGRAPLTLTSTDSGRVNLAPRGSSTLTGTGAYARAKRRGRVGLSGTRDPGTGTWTLRLSGRFTS